jgi:hypothetical protein
MCNLIKPRDSSRWIVEELALMSLTRAEQRRPYAQDKTDTHVRSHPSDGQLKANSRKTRHHEYAQDKTHTRVRSPPTDKKLEADNRRARPYELGV